MTEPMSAHMFVWFVTLCVGGVSAVWVVFDAINLARTLKLDRTDPVVRDRHFGYVIGMIIGTIGVIGTLKFHGIV
jgi:hypothetical protein